MHYFLADSFYHAILRAIHICVTIGRHCQFFSAHFLRSKCYPYLQEHTFESHSIFQATDTNGFFVTMEGTVIFTSVTNCTLTVMSLLSFMKSAKKRLAIQIRIHLFPFMACALYKCRRRDWHLENVVHKSVIFLSGQTSAATSNRQRFTDGDQSRASLHFVAVSVTPWLP